jgi:hypothetical protein
VTTDQLVPLVVAAAAMIEGLIAIAISLRSRRLLDVFTGRARLAKLARNRDL